MSIFTEARWKNFFFNRGTTSLTGISLVHICECGKSVKKIKFDIGNGIFVIEK